ncbi:MAG: energy transducer TonB [Desulfovibrionales bacterium]
MRSGILRPAFSCLQGRAEYFRGNPLAWAMIISLSWNALFLYFACEAFSTKRQFQEKSILTVDLLSEMDPFLSEIRRRIAARNQEQPSSVTFVSGMDAKKMFDKVRVSLSDKELNDALREVKAEILQYWRSTDPPSWGKVLVVMEIGRQGEILNAGINRISGPPGLEKYVIDLVKRASPFTRAMAGKEEPIWVECEFVVEAVSN